MTCTTFFSFATIHFFFLNHVCCHERWLVTPKCLYESQSHSHLVHSSVLTGNQHRKKIDLLYLLVSYFYKDTLVDLPCVKHVYGRQRGLRSSSCTLLRSKHHNTENTKVSFYLKTQANHKAGILNWILGAMWYEVSCRVISLKRMSAEAQSWLVTWHLFSATNGVNRIWRLFSRKIIPGDCL